MEKMQIPQGLRPTPEDDRDFKLGAIYRLPAVSDLPKQKVLPYTVKDQGESDFCTAFATCAMSEVQEMIELEPLYSFAAGKEISGDPQEWGQDLRTAMKAHLEGALPVSEVPDSMINQSTEYKRYLNNWLTAMSARQKAQAFFHRKKSYFKVTGPYDHFDNIRASIQKFGSPVGMGIDWNYPLSVKVIREIRTGGVGHMICVIGWDEQGLIILNSFGEDAGFGGLHYVNRKVINHFVEKYKAYMFVDIARDDAEYHLEGGSSPEDNWILMLIKRVFKWW